MGTRMKQYSPGDQIGGEYTVKDVFGGETKSGMGVVYLVQSRETPGPVVLKTYQQLLGAEAKKQFISEAHAWINAGVHANIVQAYWVREIVDQLFVCAEYIRPDEAGRNTLTHFIEVGALKTEITLLWASQFCYGMDYAKSKGIVAHRDIKPDNLMIDSTGTLKVTDFGLAKSVNPDFVTKKKGWWHFGKKEQKGTISNTNTGSVMGTLPYMAPEQFIDAKSVDCRADIYSFGIILFQMLSGNHYPYKFDQTAADIGAEFFRAHINERPMQLNSPLMGVINKCLEKKPEKRYSNYDSLLSDIRVISKKCNIKLPPVQQVSKEDEELYAKAQSYVALGDKERALSEIDEYVSRYQENYCGWTEKGRIHYERGEYTKGIDATKKSISLNPYNTHAWNNLGILLKRTDAPQMEVIDAFNNALLFDPYNVVAMANLLEPLLSEGMINEATVVASKALQLNPNKPSILHNSEALLNKLMEQQDFLNADQLLTKWTKARPQDSNAWHNLGLVSVAQKNIDIAIESFRHVQELIPNDDFSVEQLAKLYFEKKKAPECLECCNTLLERKHKMSLAVSLKARILNYIGGYKRALEFLTPYIKQNPKNDALLVVRSEVHEYRDNFNAAIQDLREARSILVKRVGSEISDNLSYIDQKINIIMSNLKKNQNRQ